MASKRAWSLLALVLGACAIPNISIVDSLDETSGGSSSKSGAANRGGTKNEPQGGNAGEEDTAAGNDSGANGGTESTAGTGPSTAGTAPSGGGGSGPMPAKTAVAKFCNAVVVSGEPVSFDLRIGEGANLVHIVAASGTCSPIVNRACVPIPTGSAVPVGIYDLDGRELYPRAVRIEPGDAWIFTLYYDEVAEDAEIAGISDISAEDCQSSDFDTLFGEATPP